MLGQTDQLHAVLGVADVGVADGGAGNFVRLPYPHLQPVHAAGQAVAELGRVLQLATASPAARLLLRMRNRYGLRSP